MRLLVVGAGASVAEGLSAGISFDNCLPVMSNFAKRMWTEFNPHPLLDDYLQTLGYKVDGDDARELFYQLESEGKINVERFFEYAWVNRQKGWSLSKNQAVLRDSSYKNHPLPKDFIRGFRLKSTNPNSITVEPNGEITWWDNMLRHGIACPIILTMIKCFHINECGWKPLNVTRSVISRLRESDLILNLNYDTLVEIALEQENRSFRYSPSENSSEHILVAKPHGSLNMVVREDECSFTFGQPTWLGTPEPEDGASYIGIIPPRFRKIYDEHPIAKMIIKSLQHLQPSQLIFWGVGLTESDADLLSLYKAWAKRANSVDVINPNHDVISKFEQLLKTSVNYYEQTDNWLHNNS